MWIWLESVFRIKVRSQEFLNIRIKYKVRFIMNHVLKNKLDKCCEIAQKGIELSPIYKEVVTYNNGTDPQFTCFENAEGKDLKGAVICSKTIKNKENDFAKIWK